MKNFSRFRLFTTFRVLAFLLPALLLASWLCADLAAQTKKKKGEEEEPAKTATQGKKPKEEEEEPAKKPPQQGKKPAKEEEEEPAKTKPRTPLRVGDEDEEARPRPKRAQNIDLAVEAKRAVFPQVQELFQGLARPHDVVTMLSGKTNNIQPVSRYVGEPPNFSGNIDLQLVDEKGEPIKKAFPVTKTEISGIEPYEHLALKKVDDFVKGLATAPETGMGALTKLEGYQQAEKALQAVLNFHLSERLQERRVGATWDELKKQLEGKLRELRLNELHILASTKDWDAAFDLAIIMAEQYRKDEAIQVEVARLMASHALQAIEAKEFKAAREHLLFLDRMFPDSRERGPVVQRLRESAEEIVRQADIQEAAKETQAALAKLELAVSISPDLRDRLQDRILKLKKEYPVLYVGVRNLPVLMSPATAVTDSEKQAVELMFESLIKLVDTPSSGQRYELELAARPPGLVSLGRQFFLDPKAFWSKETETRVTATDVRHTVQLLCSEQWAGRDPEWADDLMNKGQGVYAGTNQVLLRLSRGCLDPLSLMDFKILPREVKKVDDPNFAKAPVGSGPYMYSADKSKAGDEVVFVANPFYSRRDGKTVLPHIREIHFFKSQDPINDFNADAPRPLGLLLDLTAKRYHELQKNTPPGVKLLEPMRNRRIYFLAVNHRKPTPKSQKVRRAIGLAINRDQILDQVFRYGDRKLHRPLTGPYPPDSWACDTALPDLYHPTLARGEGAEAKNSGGGGRILLYLSYSRDDPLAQKACESIKQQVQPAGIELELKPRSAYELHQDVEVSHDYDLAYYSLDYPNDSYWLWPLFDSRGTSGRNFLGYRDDDQLDPSLQSLFRKAMTHRDFTTVRDLTHQIHRQIYESMPLVPLWQLDTLVATGNGLSFNEPSEEPRKIDPLLIFTDVEKWTKQNR